MIVPASIFLINSPDSGVTITGVSESRASKTVIDTPPIYFTGLTNSSASL